MNRQRNMIVGAVIVGILAVVLAVIYGIPAYTASQELANTSYTYNIQGRIIGVTGIVQPWKDPAEQFKYIVTVEVPDGAEPVKLSEAPHVLPELGAGVHNVPIPDSDVAGYIDWQASRNQVANPVDSNGVKIYSYTLHHWVADKIIWLTCHEEVGSSGQAELVCSEF